MWSFNPKNKFEKLVYLVGFIIKISYFFSREIIIYFSSINMVCVMKNVFYVTQ